MGIVNVTPDSFSDGGEFLEVDAAVAHGLELIGEGAQIVDVGGESTRPGAEPVAAEEELRRVQPVIEGLAAAVTGAQISIDTSKASVARASLAAGATLVNDVTALRGDRLMAGAVAESTADCCLMHMLGEPRTMQREPRYDDVVDEVKGFLHERMEFAVREGIEERRLLLDPGIGFGKTVDHNLQLLARLDELASLGRPIVIGTSRKSFLGRVAGDAGRRLGTGPRRLAATIASNVLALERGASVFRVHEVAPVREALAVAAATLGDGWRTSPAETTPTS
ncbi:MAG: dihydropteroate synthase [Solirubrobacteraceae bacterium]